MSREVTYIVTSSSAGPYRHPEFDTLEAALAHYHENAATPCYIHKGRFRHARLIKRSVTTKDKDITP